MNKDQMFSPSHFLEARSKQLSEQLQGKLNSDTPKNGGDVLREVFSSIKDFFLTIGKPTFKKRPVYDNSPPVSSDINNSFIEIYNDTRLMNDEENFLADAFKASFNNTTTERLRLRNRVKDIGEKVNDYIVTASNTISKNYVIQDSFTNITKVDMGGVNNPASVDIKSGIVTLKVNGEINRSQSAEVLEPIESVPPQPLAIPSNFLVAQKKESNSQSQIQLFVTGQEQSQEDQWELLYGTDRHDDPNTMLDGKPDSWFEYQRINVTESLKKPGANPDTKGWGWNWDSGEPIYNGDKATDSLDVTIIVKLAEKCKINWITVHPYFPDPSCYIRVNDVKTSATGAGDYVTILADDDRNSYIGTNTNTSALDVPDRHKFTGMATWTFPDRECQYVKFEFTVEKPYDCPIGHIYWEAEYDVKTTTRFLFWDTGSSSSHKKERIDGPKVNKEGVINARNYAVEGAIAGAAAGTIIPGIGTIIGGIIGFITGLFFGSRQEVLNQKVRMGLDVYTDGNGWRWCLGLRGLDICTNTYQEKCTFMSKNFAIPQGVKQVSLSVSELIPEEFWKENLVSKNTYIRYYLSGDNGASWVPISPLERSPVWGETNFAPKVIAFVDNDSEDKSANKTFVKTTETVKSLRLMAEISRPANMETSTPAIFDYKIRIVTKEMSEE